MAPLAPPVNAAGLYTLSIAVDNACAGFPDECERAHIDTVDEAHLSQHSCRHLV